MKKKQIKYLIKVLDKVQKLNNKSFDELMVENDGGHNKASNRNSRIDDHLDDVISVLSDALDDMKAAKQDASWL